ncbi:uncharacterized protein [Linepithema humile]|uniref:uncharacterized protein isoform X2 n=1 Tax=Linepithema humile TaxID=83485 RepID=UPI00351E5818
MQESDDSKEMDEEQLDDTDQRRLFQQRGNARSCEPLTEERFLKYYKTIMTKLNHVINQLQDHGRPVLNEKVDNLLPDFPLETSEALEIFNDNLQSADVCKQITRHILLIGGTDAAKLTRGILRNIMTDQLAKIYSWSGQQNTKKFRAMKVCQVIIVFMACRRYSLTVCCFLFQIFLYSFEIFCMCCLPMLF